MNKSQPFDPTAAIDAGFQKLLAEKTKGVPTIEERLTESIMADVRTEIRQLVPELALSIAKAVKCPGCAEEARKIADGQDDFLGRVVGMMERNADNPQCQIGPVNYCRPVNQQV